MGTWCCTPAYFCEFLIVVCSAATSDTLLHVHLNTTNDVIYTKYFGAIRYQIPFWWFSIAVDTWGSNDYFWPDIHMDIFLLQIWQSFYKHRYTSPKQTCCKIPHLNNPLTFRSDAAFWRKSPNRIGGKHPHLTQKKVVAFIKTCSIKHRLLWHPSCGGMTFLDVLSSIFSEVYQDKRVWKHGVGSLVYICEFMVAICPATCDTASCAFGRHQQCEFLIAICPATCDTASCAFGRHQQCEFLVAICPATCDTASCSFGRHQQCEILVAICPATCDTLLHVHSDVTNNVNSW